MKIRTVRTVRTTRQPNVCHVLLEADSGEIGLGETFYGAGIVETYLHEAVAPVLADVADPTPECVSELLRPYVGQQGSGAETRGNSAIDIALWDLWGKLSGMPLSTLLGGRVRESIPIYNTCAGPQYVSASDRQESANWGLDGAHVPVNDTAPRYEDLDAFLRRPGELASELRAEGVGGMKIWPFDRAAERTGGLRIGRQELADGLAPVQAIRDAVGDDIELMIELHGLWTPGPAAEICHALREYRPTWVEDPLRSPTPQALAELRRGTQAVIATGETIAGRAGFLPLLQAGSVDVVTVDPGWTGGITEARKVADMADTFGVPVAPHDCTGPVSLAVGTHLVASRPNGLVQETVRAFVRGWYPRVADGLPPIQGAYITPPDAPGHGVRLRDDFVAEPGTTIRTSELRASMEGTR